MSVPHSGTTRRKYDLEPLVHQILEGKVVFFIGAGFSLDSENNSAARLIFRLLVRFEALCAILQEEAGPLDLNIAREVPKLHQQLNDLFKLKKADCIEKLDPAYKTGTPVEQQFYHSYLHEDNPWTLADRYYEINDFICAAFAELLQYMPRPVDLPTAENLASWQALVPKIHTREAALLALFYTHFTEPKIEPPPPIDEYLAEMKTKNIEQAGKALFLDTMGFRDPLVMGGAPNDPDLKTVRANYRSKLFPRFHVMARLARESLTPLLLTTNYDLLIEGAYRLAGFYPKTEPQPDHGLLEKPFRVIGSPEGFFREGSGHETALVVKIHGCAQVYREKKTAIKVAHYLPSMVFTFREIQNWREDAWSRDLLNTLLRTHTMFFCGYSGQDPVIHDTLRTVYEELSGHRGGDNIEKVLPPPCFYLGGDTTPNFHGLEILRAAAKAVGNTEPNLRDFTNYFQGFYRTKNSFPDADDLYLILFHRVFRERQLQALETDLRLLVRNLVGRRPEQELADIIEAFKHRVAKEYEKLDQLLEHNTGKPEQVAETRQQIAHMIGWSWYFAPGLMRQWSHCELAQRTGQNSYLGELHMDPDHFYRPISERPDWAAWTAVVELALNGLVGKDNLFPVCTPLPTVAFRRDSGTGYHWLTIHFTRFQRQPTRPKQRGFPRQRHHWFLDFECLPWPRLMGEDAQEAEPRLHERRRKLPDADRLLEWICQSTQEVEPWLFR